ncbi:MULTISPECIES: SAM-dependent methyltransferase [Streptomyces]|nr:SAM-dependent methyltransferase [Streptomyces sp. NEAU-383]
MSKASESVVFVTLAEIARLAGVGRAAVSNWRRRYENFPAPVGGSDTSPQFSLLDVEQWLRAENKIKATVEPLDRLWPEFEALGDRETMGYLVAAVGLRLGSGGDLSRAMEPRALDAQQTGLLERAIGIAAGEGAVRTFDFLLERWLRTHFRQVNATPEPLADLMTHISALVHRGDAHTVLDPACGTGALLRAAGKPHEEATRMPKLFGQDRDPVLAALATARLAMAGYSAEVTTADTLRADSHADVRSDVVLCNPPSNERDWGHAELATDHRWAYGYPPRTEPELAWVQHAVAALAPGGVAVLVLPPAVAARRAGRRIRAGLLRAGMLRAVIALPPGAAPPHGVGLHLWVLGTSEGLSASDHLLLVDTAHGLGPASMGKGSIDWPRLRKSVTAALSGERLSESASVPVIELLDEQVDLTPARHIPGLDVANIVDLRRSWTRFDTHLRELREVAGLLSALAPQEVDSSATHTTVAELERAGAIEIHGGQGLPDELVQRGERPEDAVPVLTIPGLMIAEETEYWLPAEYVARGEADGSLTVTASPDVIVVGVVRAFEVRVDTDAPSVLGPQLYALRTDPSVLDPWFLAGCLHAPGNVRRAGTHASTSSRVDVRRLRVPRLSLDEQQGYGEIYRRLTVFQRELGRLRASGGELARSLSDLLATGRLPRN